MPASTKTTGEILLSEYQGDVIWRFSDSVKQKLDEMSEDDRQDVIAAYELAMSTLTAAMTDLLASDKAALFEGLAKVSCIMQQLDRELGYLAG